MELAVLLFVLWALQVAGQDNKITCSIPPVKPFQDTVLTCKFPEDPSVTRRDFTVNHYVRHGDPDAVIDCWWLRGNMDCYVRPGFEYNRTVNRQLSATIRSVTSSHLGRYVCQLANYEPSSLESCQLAFITDTKDTCNITQTLSEGNVILTCNFSQDISKSQANFTVYRHSDNSNQRVIDCWWENGGHRCKVADGYLVISNVSRFLAVLILEVTKETEVNYSCWHEGAEAGQQMCSLSKEEYSEDESISNLQIVLIAAFLSVAAIVAAVVTLLVRYGRILLFRCCGQQSSNSHETQALLEVREKQEVTKQFEECLEKTVKEMYPEITEVFCFVPPVYLNKTRYKIQDVGSQTVYVPDPSDPSDVRHDVAMQQVMRLLHHMAEHRDEKMFVLTQFKYEDYLNNPGKDFERHLLPTAVGLREEPNRIKCFDFIIIHQNHGLVIGVVNPISDEAVERENTKQNTDEDIAAQLNESIKQLQKADRMIRHFVSDQEQCPKIQHVLILPKLSQTSLHRAVASQCVLDQVEAVLPSSTDLQADVWKDPSALCLCADHLPDPNTAWDVSSTNIGEWWDRLMTSTHEDILISNGEYLRLVSRFCGPATQLTLRVQDKPFILPKTLAEAVVKTADLYERIMLDPDLMDLFKEKRLFLVGPPNTCKARMLTLAGEKWMNSRSDLYVIFGGLGQCDPVMEEFCEKLKQKPDAAPPENSSNHRAHVYRINCNFNKKREVQETLDALTIMKGDNPLCVLASEVDVNIHHLKSFKTFCENLKKRRPDLHLWAKSSISTEAPDGWKKVQTFTRLLNCPPAVITAASQTSPGYITTSGESNTPSYLPPTSGPPVKYIHHKKEDFMELHDCTQCGIEVAGFLSKHLSIRGGKESPAESLSSTTDRAMALGEDKSTAITRSVLHYRDLLVLFEVDKRQQEDFLKGLTKGGIAVRPLEDVESKDRFERESDFACAMHIDHLVRYRPRRKVVVYVENKTRPRDPSARWRGMTCCTSQLILVRRNLE